jgi:hypothetical protein
LTIGKKEWLQCNAFSCAEKTLYNQPQINMGLVGYHPHSFLRADEVDDDGCRCFCFIKTKMIVRSSCYSFSFFLVLQQAL